MLGLVVVSRMPYTVVEAACGARAARDGRAADPGAASAGGIAAYGASRWFDIGPVTLQPSELAKLALLAFAATMLAREVEASWTTSRHARRPARCRSRLLVAGIVILQRDLGTTVILCGSVFLLLFVAGVR